MWLRARSTSNSTRISSAALATCVTGRDRPDSEVIADAVAAFVGFAALDAAHAQGGLTEDEANELAVAEVRAHRADRGRAA